MDSQTEYTVYELLVHCVEHGIPLTLGFESPILNTEYGEHDFIDEDWLNDPERIEIVVKANRGQLVVEYSFDPQQPTTQYPTYTYQTSHVFPANQKSVYEIYTRLILPCEFARELTVFHAGEPPASPAANHKGVLAFDPVEFAFSPSLSSL